MFSELLWEAKAQKRWSSQWCSMGVRIVDIISSYQGKEDATGEICERKKATVKRGGETHHGELRQKESKALRDSY